MLSTLSNDKILLYYKRYKDYIQIRRNLRESYRLLDKCIKMSYSIKQDVTLVNEFSNNFYLYVAVFSCAVNLYSRWFKQTENKTKLDAKEFFKNNDNLLETHKRIIELRDKYIAHYEEDLLSKDYIILEIHENNYRLSSNWEMEPWVQNEISLVDFRECIIAVHNKIDSEKLPKLEQLLLEELKVNWGETQRDGSLDVYR